MSKRKIKNIIPKPNYIGKFRQIHGVLRNNKGFMIFSVIENGNVIYKLTDVLDLPIKPNNIGRREFNKKWLTFLESHVVNDNYIGDLFMYCTHQEDQKLLSINEYTINRNTKQFHRLNKDGLPVQPYCKESKKLYQNGYGNKMRTSEQYIEGSQGSRTRGLLTSLCCDTSLSSIKIIFAKYGGRCFATGKILDINERGSYQIDHMMAASGYHPLNDKNVVLLSTDANQEKNDQHPIKFFGIKKFKELCGLLGINPEDFKDENYILNDNVLYYFNDNFDDVIYKWHFEINRNKDSFKKYLNKEISRITKKDIYSRHVSLLNKMKEYEKKI